MSLRRSISRRFGMLCVVIGASLAWQAAAQEPEVPWKGIRNNVFDLFDPLKHGRDFCGGGGPLEGETSLPIRPVANSVQFLAHAKDRRPTKEGESANAIWGERLELKRYSQEKNKAIVRQSFGGEIQRAGAKRWRKARAGNRLREGMRVRTDVGGIVDIFLEENGPLLRVAQDSEVELVRMWVNRGGLELDSDTMLEVKRGRVAGKVRKLSKSSSYLVRTNGGVVRVRGTEFEIHADGACGMILGEGEVITDKEVITVKQGEAYRPESAAK